MKICKVVIENYQQFKHLELDFTHPETGEPLEQICFIGSNGTGKSTLLDILTFGFSRETTLNQKLLLLTIELDYENRRYKFGRTLGKSFFRANNTWDNQLLTTPFPTPIRTPHTVLPDVESGLGEIFCQTPLNGNSLVVKVEAESDVNSYKQTTDVPSGRLNDVINTPQTSRVGLELVNQSNVATFWKNLIFHTAQRERERNEFENQPENLNKTKRQLIDEFDSANPKILDRLAHIWNRILEKAGLEFDVDNAKLPVQLTDNLYAYIKLKATGERINYNQLSTGIRNFIFRIGHIYSLYFNREIENGFLFVDEPENSLFPDFLLDLLDIYKEVTTDKNGHRNTQMFFATHNPIVAAQFQPYERVILEWADDGFVTARRGTAPIGDDPNDVLIKDFEISSLMPTAGVEMWEKYLNLKRQLRQTADEDQKEALVTQVLQIGQEYNFPRDQPKP
ncbi:AAA family ATPase [Rudanella lutea]|uniref:AAA family ATPase n=1 Tax=Rudanella lutea TaxID=451374 RepID=UPI000A01D263|nr:AAA family ATPase [Rudanella lutea]